MTEFLVEAFAPARPDSPWFAVRFFRTEGTARDYAEEFASAFACRVRVLALASGAKICEFDANAHAPA